MNVPLRKSHASKVSRSSAGCVVVLRSSDVDPDGSQKSVANC